MAHEITIRENNFAETAFVGDTPWHGLGQHIHEDSTIEEWAAQAGMNWSVNSGNVYYETDVDGPMTGFIGQNVLYRSDTGMPLSVVSDRYKPVQPIECLEFFRNLIVDNGFKIQVAGTLKGGKRLWAIADTGRYAEVTKGDGVGGFLLLSTSCDRTLSTTARFTSVRVVCNNTLQMAMEDNSHCVKFTHMQHFNVGAAQDKLMKGVESFGSFIKMAQYMQQQQMDSNAANRFLVNLVSTFTQVDGEGYDITQNRTYAKILRLFDGEAKGSNLVGHTRWGMLNAVTEYYDHLKPAQNTDARLDSAWFGAGNKIKDKATHLLLHSM